MRKFIAKLTQENKGPRIANTFPQGEKKGHPNLRETKHFEGPCWFRQWDFGTGASGTRYVFLKAGR